MFELLWVLLASALVWVIASVVTSLVLGRMVMLAEMAAGDERDYQLSAEALKSR